MNTQGEQGKFLNYTYRDLGGYPHGGIDNVCGKQSIYKVTWVTW